jgi:hypothetical protein
MRRTPEIKEAMTRALRTAMEYLNHREMPTLPQYENPRAIADSLVVCIELINAPLRSKIAKKALMTSLQRAADYLSNPAVTRIPYAVRSSNIARMLREVIRDLK